MNYLITGGTGTIGRQLVRTIYQSASKIVVYSRDEQKHKRMMDEFPEYPDNKMRYVVGDVRNYDRLYSAMRGIDCVIHCAAMKHIDVCEYNSFESTDININGSSNVIKCAGENSVRMAFMVSTDKACLPVSIYGAQKYCAEQLFINANALYPQTQFNVMRYGNVFLSEGSIIAKWREMASKGVCLPVTDDRMTRFFWSIEQASNFIVTIVSVSILNQSRGIIFVPIMNKYKMVTLARQISKNFKIVGLRCIEKLHEDLISEPEAANTYELQGFYMIYPHSRSFQVKIYGNKVPQGFKLTSEVENDL